MSVETPSWKRSLSGSLRVRRLPVDTLIVDVAAPVAAVVNVQPARRERHELAVASQASALALIAVLAGDVGCGDEACDDRGDR